jgi:probable HAF family extracellular repeat protein
VSNRLRMILVATVVLFLGTKVEASSMYTITDLGSLPGYGTSIATSINDLGQVVGYANVAGAPNPIFGPQSFLYSNGQMTPITPIGGGPAYSINDSGVIVGSNGLATPGQIGGQPFQVPYVQTANGVTTQQASFWPMAINDSGQVAGEVFVNHGMSDAAIYQNGQVLDITKAMAQTIYQPNVALAIDKAGDVLVAQYTNNNSPFVSPYMATLLLYKADGTTQVVSLGGPTTDLLAVPSQVGLNDAGQVVGNQGLWANGQYTPLINLIPSKPRSV